MMNQCHFNKLFEEVALEVLSFKRQLQPKTYSDYESHLRLHLLPWFKGKEIREVGALWKNYKVYQKKLNRKRRLNHDLKHLKSILIRAKELNIINDIPQMKVDPIDKRQSIPRVYSKEEYYALINASSKKWQLIIDMAIVLGMRFGEIRNLKWENINLKSKTLVLKRTKTHKERIVPIENSIIEKLFAMDKNNSYVFPNAKTANKPMSRTDRTWCRIKRRAGIKGRFHDLRHTSITWALEAGMPPTLVQKSRGVSDRVMYRIYTHCSIEKSREISDSIRAFLIA